MDGICIVGLSEKGVCSNQILNNENYILIFPSHWVRAFTDHRLGWRLFYTLDMLRLGGAGYFTHWMLWAKGYRWQQEQVLQSFQLLHPSALSSLYEPRMTNKTFKGKHIKNITEVVSPSYFFFFHVLRLLWIYQQSCKLPLFFQWLPIP